MLAALLACTAPEPTPWSTPFVHTVVPWVQDSTGHWLLLDTGTPRTQIRPDVVGLSPGLRAPSGWSVGQFDPGEVLVSADLPDPMLEAEARGDIQQLGGIVGADVLLGQRWWLDPRSSTLWVDQDPPGVRPVTEVPVTPEGAGRSCFSDVPCFDYEGARVLVDAEVNGVPVTLLLDTGATYVMLEASVVEQADLPVYAWAFDDMVLPIGAAEVGLGDARETEVAVLVAPDEIEASLVGLELEVDRRVDGVIGHTFLRRWVLGLDAPEGTLTLGEYTAGPWSWNTNWRNPGFGVTDGGADCFSVQFVIEGSPAATRGMVPGDCVTAVDGLTPQDVDAGEVMDRFEQVGSEVEVTVEMQGEVFSLVNQSWAS